METRVYIDFDGVILDTQYYITLGKAIYSELSWAEYVKIINWRELIKKSNVINDSIRILRSLNKKENFYILTRVHSFLEANEKILFLRSNKIELPVIITPPDMSKEIVIYPNNKDILVDDYIGNLIPWIEKGGYGILFDNNDIHQEIKDIEKQKNLSFLKMY